MPNQPESTAVAALPEVKPKSQPKKRPAALDLSLSADQKEHLNDLALKLISPGLATPLSREQRTTVAMSRSIERRQQGLIQRLLSGETGEPSSPSLDDGGHSLPTPAKSSLRRSNIPKPLDMSQVAGPEPAVKSAPISLVRRYNQRVRYPHSAVNRRFAMGPYQPYSMARTPVASRGIRSRYAPYGMATPRELRVSERVTKDVFVDSRTRAAPLVAQPMSAQREVFDFHSQPVAQGEDSASEDEDVEAAIEPGAVETPSVSRLPKQPVVGEIRLSNEIYRFEFDRKDEEKEAFMKICSKVWDEFAKK